MQLALHLDTKSRHTIIFCIILTTRFYLLQVSLVVIASYLEGKGNLLEYWISTELFKVLLIINSM